MSYMLLWRVAPIFTRVLLIYAIFNFGVVGMIYIINPFPITSQIGIELNSAVAVTNARVGLGGFHVGVAVMAAYCAFSKHRVWAGLQIALCMTIVPVLARVYGVFVDGPEEQTLMLLRVEGAALLIFLIGVMVHWRYGPNVERGGPSRANS